MTKMTTLQAKQILHENWMLLTTCGRDTEVAQALAIAETVLGDYNKSLRKDMLALLNELQTEIKEDGCKDTDELWWIIEKKIDYLLWREDVK